MSVLVSCVGALAAATAQAAPGDLDPTFSRNGLVRAQFGELSSAESLAIQPDGRIVVAGQADGGVAVFRFTPDGRLDRSFSSDGRLRVEGADSRPGWSSGGELALQPDGKIVVAGSSESGLVLARYTAEGIPDRSFSGDGRLITHFYKGPYDRVNDVTLDDHGRIVIAGRVQASEQAGLRRFQPNGTPDTSFSGDGLLTVDLFAGNAVLVDSDGRLVLGGTTLARFMPNGDPDPSFSDDGRASADIIDYYAAGDIALHADGRVVTAGTTCVDDLYPACYLGAAQFKPDGSLDSSFGDQGIEVFQVGYEATGRAVALTGDSGIVIAGGTLPERFGTGPVDFALLRLGPDGVRERSFRGDGIWTTDFLSGDDGARDVALQRDGKIVAAGFSDAHLALARYEVEAGPPDADADGLRDDADRCPSRFADSRHGCPRYRRSLTMAFHKALDVYVGTLRSREPRCVDYEKVRVMRARRGRDFEVDTTTTNYAGRWSVDARLHPGRYYAIAPLSSGVAYGRCLKASANGFRI